jgi:hypothetical protein
MQAMKSAMASDESAEEDRQRKTVAARRKRQSNGIK